MLVLLFSAEPRIKRLAPSRAALGDHQLAADLQILLVGLRQKVVALALFQAFVGCHILLHDVFVHEHRKVDFGGGMRGRVMVLRKHGLVLACKLNIRVVIDGRVHGRRHLHVQVT